MVCLTLIQLWLLRVGQLWEQIDGVESAQLVLIVLESQNVDNWATSSAANDI